MTAGNIWVLAVPDTAQALLGIKKYKYYKRTVYV